MKIPFSPPFINKDVVAEVTDALESGWITTGPKVKKLERLVCHYTGASNTLCVNSATSGLMLALKWYDIKPGDEVIIPAYTYAATALAVIHVGATPKMVDVDEDFNISINAIQKAITPKTKAIISVDIAGWPCNYDEIKTLSIENQNVFKPESKNQKLLNRILIISDAAHAIGATYKGQSVGTTSDLTVFSFHAVKNVTTAEGGAITLNLPNPFNNQEVYDYLRCFSLNGQTKDAFTKSKAGSWKYDIIYPGMKINMPDVLAAIGIIQLPLYFSEILDKRYKIYTYYQDYFKSKPWAILPQTNNEEKTGSCHLYPLRIKNINEQQRDAIINAISEAGVAVNVHFQPLPMLSLFKNMGFDINKFPIAYNNFKSEISLPIYPQLTNRELDYIVKTVNSAVESKI
ncbi:DegT/DnrJ/EryC1/StrS family aminotransferase [Bizionia sp. KMM 8389]